MSTRKTTLFYAVLLAIASVAIGMVLASRLDLSPTSGAQTLTVAPPANSAPITGAIDATTFRTIAKDVSPAVVNIRTETTQRTEELTEFFGGEDLLRRFFPDQGQGQGQGRGAPQGRRGRVPPSQGAGTGFIIDAAEGLILTNNHVVENANKIVVAFYGNDSDIEFEAKVVGRDPLTDSALIQLLKKPTQSLQQVKFGDSDQMQPGDFVVAIGNPFNFSHTVTVGVISALERPFPVAPQRSVNMLQTDAAINPGNSGGPLLNVRGEVVGVNTAILSDRNQASNMGIGFAVPINLVRELVPQLRSGKVTRGMIGVSIGVIDAQAFEDYGLTSRSGALVSAVTRAGPAAQAGLKPLDVIVEYNSRAVKNRDQLVDLVTRTKPGTTVALKVLRDGKNVPLNVTIGELDLEAEAGQPAEESAVQETSGFGLGLEDITPDIARRLEIPRSTTGALVTDVEPGSAAVLGGLRRFDVITQVNGQPVTSAADASRKLQAVATGRLARILVLRGGQELGLAIRKE
ncbi:MAG: trypsin-like peptidase domain-containing protein [Acidobacteria bacterium]|nr:trypsin-like peptidase domain-containing protein [Acidobacteriota bacterium]